MKTIIHINLSITLSFLFCISTLLSYSQNPTFLKGHFLYGSKPAKKHKGTEQKWFGGVLGGHVGIEGDSNRVINFLPSGKFHWFAKNDNKHSTYAVHSVDDFYRILGGSNNDVKKAIVYIPVTTQQKQTFDSISAGYLKQAPYDYALFGMRCGAATYEVLGQLEILTKYSYGKTYRKIFYPKKLRKKLFKKAKENGWTIVRQDGSNTRKWEQD